MIEDNLNSRIMKLVVDHTYNLPEILKAERLSRSLTQKELAKLAHVGENTVALTEKGRTNPSVEVLTSIVRALGYDEIVIKL